MTTTDDRVCTDVRDLAAALPNDVLADEVVGLVRRLSSGTYQLLVLVGELDARGCHARWGAHSCAAWLARVCDLEISTARSHVRVARAMRAHPVLDHAMATGDVSYAKARVLVPHLEDDNVDELVELAAVTPSGRLGAAIAAWSLQHEDPEHVARRHHRERAYTSRVDADGMVTIVVRLAPARAAAVDAAVDRLVRARRAPAGASLAQQRADAFVHAVSAGGRVTTEVVLHVRGYEASTLADGTPLSDHAVASLLPDSFVSLLVHDAQRNPIDASPRRRTPTRRQRRVLDERQPVCAHPGCTADVFLQYEHLIAYVDGGQTVLDNLSRMCGRHNRDKEAARREGDPP